MYYLWIWRALLVLNKRLHMSHSVVVEAGSVGNGRCTGVSWLEERSLLPVSICVMYRLLL